MDTSLVRKIAKAKDYSMQPNRVKFSHCEAEFQGDNGNHKITYEAGRWRCDCHYFRGRDTCSHVMAMQMILDGMAPTESAEPVAS